MDAIKQYMKPKWWLIVIGALGVITGVGNFATAEDSAEMGWGEDEAARGGIGIGEADPGAHRGEASRNR